MTVSPRPLRIVATLVALVLLAASCSGSNDGDDGDEEGATATTVAGRTPGDDCVDSTDTATDPQVAEIVAAVESVREELDLQAVLVRVERGGEEVVTIALGESVVGVPATADMRFWNGAAVFSYLGTAMLQLDEEGVLDIDAPIETYLPDAPAADRITPRMLMANLSGYTDYERSDAWIDALYADPFRPFTQEELESYVFPEPLLFEPGTNVSYSHLNFRLAGEVIAEATGQPLEDVLAERVLDPLGMDGTESLPNADIPAPRLHTFTGERGDYEDSSLWSPAWGVPEGAVMATTVCDLATAARGVGSGELLSEESFEVFVDPGTVEVGRRTDECPSCIPNTPERHLGLGINTSGDWLVQTPLFTGIAGVQAYLPSQDLAIGAANTFGPDADVSVNGSNEIMERLSAILAPEARLPAR